MFQSQEVVAAAVKKLGLEKTKILNPKKIMAKFSKADVTDQEMIDAKNIVLVSWIESNQSLRPEDYNKLQVKVKNPCRVCGGKGVLINTFKVEMTKCKFVVFDRPDGKKAYQGCAGTGWRIGECQKCHGTGKIGEQPCPTCFDHKHKISRGTYQYRPTKGRKGKDGFDGIKCINCGGSGKIPKLIQRPSEIESVCTCEKCKGTGANNEVGTPVINLENASKLKSLVIPERIDESIPESATQL